MDGEPEKPQPTRPAARMEATVGASRLVTRISPS
jgi:hypothetical protein